MQRCNPELMQRYRFNIVDIMLQRFRYLIYQHIVFFFTAFAGCQTFEGGIWACQNTAEKGTTINITFF